MEGALGGLESLFHQSGAEGAESAHLRDADGAGATSKAPGDLWVFQSFHEAELNDLALTAGECGE